MCEISYIHKTVQAFFKFHILYQVSKRKDHKCRVFPFINLDKGAAFNYIKEYL